MNGFRRRDDTGTCLSQSLKQPGEVVAGKSGPDHRAAFFFSTCVLNLGYHKRYATVFADDSYANRVSSKECVALKREIQNKILDRRPGVMTSIFDVALLSAVFAHNLKRTRARLCIQL